jgi:Flp pilus assembly protein TadG
MKLPFRRRGNRTRGQALVEFALILPILALFLMLALDFGRVFFGWVALNNASRIAANAAAVHPDAWNGSGNPNAADWQAQYRQSVANDLNSINCDAPGHSGAWLATDIPNPTFVNVTGTASPYENGDHAQVKLICDFHFLTPLVGNILGNPLVIAATSEFPVRGAEINGLALNQGCNGAIVPNLVGETVAVARSTWTSAGFLSGTFSPASGSDTDTVTVQTTSPVSTPGQCLPTNSSVTVTHVAAGGQCSMPQMVGQKVNSAQSAFTAAGFTGTFTITRPPQGNYDVTSQSLVGGQSYACSTGVTVAGN